MPTYTTPGVWVEEIASFPPSVAQVATAIPAFLGYTEKGAGKVARITSLLEYEAQFGKAKSAEFTAVFGDGDELLSLSRTDQQGNPFLLYYGLSLYFRNGGGPCYVASVGDYKATPAKKHFEDGLASLKMEDEPTLIVLLDAVSLAKPDYYDLAKQALAQCHDLGDRFTILDVLVNQTTVTKDVADFRAGVGNDYLSYGAAYHPFLQTTLNYQYDEKTVSVTGPGGSGGAANASAGADGKDTPTPSPAKTFLADIKTTNTSRYNKVKAALGDVRVVLPPSPAIAGIYARTDAERGVWKAPANVSIASVLGPISKISNDDQGLLNVDPNSGKSINAIRDFVGKGTLVWGARTLLGNDNEWRYVPVRRLFITIEESTRKASSFAVFEPNDATTWLKVKAMIDSYLYGLWEQGALAGSKPEQAYFVNVGLGKTMTAQDILEGRMIVEIGVAAVRPAEFILLRFSHKMQEA